MESGKVGKERETSDNLSSLPSVAKEAISHLFGISVIIPCSEQFTFEGLKNLTFSERI